MSMLDAHRAEASPAFLQSSRPGFGDNAFVSHVMNRPRGTLARCPEMNDAWARNGKPDRFKRDVRVIHPAKAHQGRRRQHSEANSHPRVPASSRAPDFVRQVDDPGQALVERRLVAEPPMRLGGRVGGEGSAGVQAARWNRRPGTSLPSSAARTRNHEKRLFTGCLYIYIYIIYDRVSACRSTVLECDCRPGRMFSRGLAGYVSCMFILLYVLYYTYVFM